MRFEHERNKSNADKDVVYLRQQISLLEDNMQENVNNFFRAKELELTTDFGDRQERFKETYIL